MRQFSPLLKIHKLRSKYVIEGCISKTISWHPNGVGVFGIHNLVSTFTQVTSPVGHRYEFVKLPWDLLAHCCQLLMGRSFPGSQAWGLSWFCYLSFLCQDTEGWIGDLMHVLPLMKVCPSSICRLNKNNTWKASLSGGKSCSLCIINAKLDVTEVVPFSIWKVSFGVLLSDHSY